MKTIYFLPILLVLNALTLSGCERPEVAEAEHEHEEHHTIWVTNPKIENVTITLEYVCQIHSCRHIEVCALESGYLEAIRIKEGQKVKSGEPLFTVLPTLYQAKLETEKAEAQLAQIEFNNTSKLVEQNVVSTQELALAQAKLDKAKAQVKLAEAELNFTVIKAPFDGIVDRLHEQQGSLVEEGDMLTTMSDNSLMWVYFNVPEARYLEYMAESDEVKANEKIELVLANGKKFPETGKIGAIEADFNNETGNIAFRADFPNPESVLRHGQTGKVLIRRALENAVVIPQRTTFEILDKRFVLVVGEDKVVHQREIEIQYEMEDIFVIQSGLSVEDKIVLEGVRQVHDGEKLEKFEVRSPEESLSNQKFHAE